jgi:hypothetical protein
LRQIKLCREGLAMAAAREGVDRDQFDLAQSARKEMGDCFVMGGAP